jgi:hypothetical protein
MLRDPFRGGIPYAIDVKRLSEAFPVPSLNEGRVIEHSELSAVLEMRSGTPRYYSVVNSWIGQTRALHGIYIIWQPSTGIKVLDPALLLTHAENKTRQKIRQTGRAVSIYGWVDRARLDSLGQQRLDHHSRVIGALNDAMHAARKNLAVPLSPIRSLPKREIGAPGAPARPKDGENDKAS